MLFQSEANPQPALNTALERIEQLNAETRAFITVTPPAPNTGGLPIAVKDLFDTKDIRTTAGSKVFEARIPRKDAEVVAKLKNAGAVIVGKTNLHEFAFGVTNVNPHYGTPRNPWDPERICGGSSGGSACAVVHGMAFAALGTDTGGSIRIPAAFCGIVGMKPTYGCVSLKGVVPLSWSFDHAGPMTRTVKDAAALLEAMSGRQYIGALTGSIKGVRVGVPKSYFFEALSHGVETAMQKALRDLERLGARMIEVDLPGVAEHRAVWNQIALPEAFSYHEKNLQDHAALYGSDVRDRLELGGVALSADYMRAQRVRSKMKSECTRIFETVDFIVTPTVPIAAPRIADLDRNTIASIARCTRFFNIVGLPAISIPCGFTTEGLPLGMQIAGRAFDEAGVFRVAHAYEQDTKWFEHLKKFL